MSSVPFRSLLVLVLTVLPLLVGCGAQAGSGPEGASVAPASAALFLSVETDFNSDQWQKAKELVDEFPDGEKAVGFLLDELGIESGDFEREVKPALGPETDVVGLDLAGEGEFVGLTQPENEEKLKDILARLDAKIVTRDVAGWTAFADSTTPLDHFEAARKEGTLAGSGAYDEAMAQVDGDALIHLYVNSTAAQQAIQSEDAVAPSAFAAMFPGGQVPSFAAAVKAEGGGVRFEGAAKIGADEGGLVPQNFEAGLPDEVPGDVLLYLDFNDLESPLSALRDVLGETMPDFDRDLARAEHELGLSLEEDLFPLFAGESALYIRRGFFLPEVTLLTEVEHEQDALATVEKLVRVLEEYLPGAQPAHQTTIDGVSATQVPLGGPFSLFFAAFDGRLVVTTSQEGITALREDNNRLADDPAFKAALDDAGVPDETTGFGYVNLDEAIPYLLGFVDAAGGGTPPAARANLAPLEHAAFYGTRDGDTLRVAAFLAVD
jgi:Protein of unknown function (DUF3352)